VHVAEIVRRIIECLFAREVVLATAPETGEHQIKFASRIAWNKNVGQPVHFSSNEITTASSTCRLCAAIPSKAGTSNALPPSGGLQRSTFTIIENSKFDISIRRI
jgi:hypothetical protein